MKSSDGRCYYPLGSCDQTLPWFFGLHAYVKSGLCEDGFRAVIVGKMLEVAKAMESVGWRVPCEWSSRGEYCGDFARDSLPFRGATHYQFILLALYDVTGDAAWRDEYLTARDEIYPGFDRTRLKMCEGGYLVDKPYLSMEPGLLWIYVCAQGYLASLEEMEIDHAVAALYRKGLAAGAESARKFMAEARKYPNVTESPFLYARWRDGYDWRPQTTRAEADAVAKTGKKEILGRRKNLERDTMTAPLASAAICAYAGLYRDEVFDTLRVFDYDTICISEFFLAEVAFYASKSPDEHLRPANNCRHWPGGQEREGGVLGSTRSQ